MTLDDEKVSVQRFVLRCNVSACYQELSNKTDQPWITVCGHIFCVSCGLAELGKLPAICPICCHQLTSPFDIIQSELNPPSHFVEMVLMGLNPNDCLEAARRGISFWQSQSILQLNSSENNVENTRSQIMEMQSHYEDKVAMMNREIFTLREECQRLKEENSKSQHHKAPVVADHPTLNIHEQQKAVAVTTVSTIGTGTVKKQSYPRPSIPLQHVRPTSSRNDSLPQRQFLGKF
ncbi:E3 ubiquitin-protein ligase CCNB1IP1-like [Daphnia carinata]|uniref:E3 ubiquitin-protein ligase CCNB1IP1-like n=1 Tax=Daphnia carinata TaxID=120202 RepID=UPI00257B66DE|nr:E3 ubiquitin-protein ligase CCNB1IP1-like [Daphnia carinata]